MDLGCARERERERENSFRETRGSCTNGPWTSRAPGGGLLLREGAKRAERERENRCPLRLLRWVEEEDKGRNATS